MTVQLSIAIPDADRPGPEDEAGGFHKPVFPTSKPDCRHSLTWTLFHAIADAVALLATALGALFMLHWLWCRTPSVSLKEQARA